jgi:indolepyruvate ferredoxin oxidoreductase alpha subunit
MSTTAPSGATTKDPAAPQILIMSGNEAIARGAWEAGVRFASAYPGTPSTEILESLRRYEDVYAEWAPNEKVAVEAATGASMAGARALVCMKHVGLNVAADPFFSASYIGVKGGLVVVSADDPAMHSSQDEQDNRQYARFAKMPMIEAAEAGEAIAYVRAAFDLSERFDTPVLFRTTTRTSHSQGIVELGERVADLPPILRLDRDPAKNLMMPHNARCRHVLVEQRLLDVAEWAESTDLNRIEMGDPRVGIVTSGASYGYAREAFPEASFLKLGLTYPLPRGLIAEFRAQVEKLYVVEELDPFLEELIRLQGIEVDGGKDILPLIGEFDPGLVARTLSAAGVPGVDEDLLQTPETAMGDLIDRPPTLCPGCSHRGVFVALRKMKAFVSGDIGCYSLAALPPFEAMHCSTCMGAGISMAHGMAKVVDEAADARNRAVAIIGDSTFFHSGITSLLDVAYNQSDVLTIILDNRTTAMTGGQQNPGTGKVLQGRPAPEVDIPGLCRALGVRRIAEIDPFDVAQTESVLREELAAREPSVVIATSPCALQFRIHQPAWSVDQDVCDGCKVCLRAGCTALSLIDDGGPKERRVAIDAAVCNGCGVCAQLCRFGAITGPEPVDGKDAR